MILCVRFGRRSKSVNENEYFGVFSDLLKKVNLNVPIAHKSYFFFA